MTTKTQDPNAAPADEAAPAKTPQRVVSEILGACGAISGSCDGGIVVGRLRDAGWDVVDQQTAVSPERVEELEATAAARDEALKDMRKERDAWQQHRQSDDEAQAISECVKALDKLEPRQSSRYSTITYSSPGQMERVLKYLADRYGVTWYTPPAPEPAPVDPEEVARAVVSQINFERQVVR